MDILYFFLFLAAIQCAVTLWFFRQRLDLNLLTVIVLAVVHTILGVLCVKLFSAIEMMRAPSSAGLSLFGSIFFLPIFYVIGAKLFKREVATVFDIFVLNLIGALAIVRVNCIITGCCYGKLIVAGGVVRWPTREIEIIFQCIVWIYLFIKLVRKEPKGYIKGSLYPLYMIFYGIFRFVEEWFRETQHFIGVAHLSHFWAVACFAVGCSIYLTLKERQHKKGKHKK